MKPIKLNETCRLACLWLVQSIIENNKNVGCGWYAGYNAGRRYTAKSILSEQITRSNRRAVGSLIRDYIVLLKSH